MKTSEQMTKMPAALLKAQATITFAAKGSVNAHFKNKYADLAAVIDAVKSALNDNGIAFVQTASPSQDGFLNLTTRLIHESGEWIEDTLTMPLQKCDPQGYGSAMTYARRYSLAAITGLYQDDDDGNQACRPKQEAKADDKAVQPPRESAKSVSKDTWDKLDAETQNWLRDMAMEAKLFFAKNDAVSAYEYLESQGLDADLKVAISYLFESNERAALKKISTTRKAA